MVEKILNSWKIFLIFVTFSYIAVDSWCLLKTACSFHVLYIIGIFQFPMDALRKQIIRKTDPEKRVHWQRETAQKGVTRKVAKQIGRNKLL